MTEMSQADPRPSRKIPMPPLDARAPRPAVVRLRAGVVAAVVVGATGLVAGSLAWAFVVQPELRDRARSPKSGHDTDARGTVRASELITDHPATYGQLPAPRRLGGSPPEGAADPRPGPAARSDTAAPSVRVRRANAASEARGSGLFFMTGRGGEPAAPASSGRPPGPDRDYGAVYNSHDLLKPLSPYELKAGALIPAVLLTGVDTARAGPVVATVTENVHDSVSGRHLLAPQGTRLIGRHEGESRHGDKRAFLIWERMILPNGKSLVLAGEPGVDAQGAVGVPGRVDRRVGALVVATLFAGAITTVGQAARDRDDASGGWWADAGDAAAIEAAQLGGKLIDRELDVRPSIRLRPGARVRVLITRDLILEPYRP